MKKTLVTLLMFAATCALAQNSRYDQPFPSVSGSTSTPFLVANVPPNSPKLAVCNSPANTVPCTNYATTFNSAGIACPNGAQDTPQPQPSACQSTGDAQGNIGFWAPAGKYDYTVCIGNTCFGPYTVTLGGSGGGGGGVSQVLGVANQTVVTNGSTVPVVGIANSPTLPGTVSMGGLNFTGSSLTMFGKAFTGTAGSSGIFQQGGPVIGIATACFDGTGNVTNVGCPPVTATAAGTTTEVQFRNAGSLAADALFNYTSATHTLNAQNVTVGGAFTVSSPLALTTSIPVSPCVPSSMGQSFFGINSTGNFAISANGGPCNDIPTIAGAGIVGAPPGTQTVTQPVATTLYVNNENNIRWVTPAYNWSQTGVCATGCTSNALVAGTGATLTLTPCPAGIVGTDNTSMVYISGTGTAEAVTMTGAGSCTPGAVSGTISFTPGKAHAAGFLIGTASQGIQEALVDAFGNGGSIPHNNFVVKFPPTNPPGSTFYVVNGTVSIPYSIAEIDGEGATIECENASRCFLFGSSPGAVGAPGLTTTLGGKGIGTVAGTGELHIHGFRVASNTVQAGAAITQLACSGTTATITTSLNPPLGEFVDIQSSDNSAYWGIHQVATTSGTNWTYAVPNCTGFTNSTSPGGNALLHTFIEDNAQAVNMSDIYNDTPGTLAGNLNNIIVVDNDQAAVISHLISQGLVCTTGYCGQAVYAPGGSTALAALGYISNSSLSMNCIGNGIKWMSGNTLDISDTVVQGFSQFALQSGTLRGSFGATLARNVYTEVGNCANPYWDTALSLSAGTGACGNGPACNMAGANIMGGNFQQSGGFQGTSGSITGLEPTFATGGANNYEFWVVAHDTTASLVSAPFRFGSAAPASNGTVNVAWPRIPPPVGTTDTITYDILVTGPSASIPTAPVGTNSVVLQLGIAQCAGLACAQGFTYTGGFTTSACAPTTCNANPTLAWYPTLNNFPDISIGSATYNASAGTGGSYVADVLGSAVITACEFVPCIFTQQQTSGNPGGYISALAGISSGNNNAAVGSTVMQNGPLWAGQTANLKGRLIFNPGLLQSVASGSIITLNDSNPMKTWADAWHRPTMDANDSAIGFDSGSVGSSAAVVAFSAPQGFHWYTGTTFDGSSWIEGLSPSLKTFKVPMTTNSQITSTLANGTAPRVTTSQTRIANEYTGGNPGLIYCGTTTACAKTQNFNGFVVYGTVTLVAGTASYSTLPFASTSWLCDTFDITTPGTTSSMVQVTDSTHATVTGTGTHVIGFQCTGN